MKKRCKVVALPTKGMTQVAYNSETNTYFNPCILPIHHQDDYIHLYIVSDDEIKEDDCIIMNDKSGFYIFDSVNNTHDIECKDGCISPFKTKEYFKKIIATTDPSLNLPLIPKQFVEDYCDANGIEKVVCEVNYSVVSISPLKESWSRKELPIESIIQF